MSILKVGQLQDTNGNVLTPARAWVNFNGTGAVPIRASNNVSSITDNGTGDYIINFTNALQDANYAVVGSAGHATSSTGLVTTNYLQAPSVSAVRILTSVAGGTAADFAYVCVSVFR